MLGTSGAGALTLICGADEIVMLGPGCPSSSSESLYEGLYCGYSSDGDRLCARLRELDLELGIGLAPPLLIPPDAEAALINVEVSTPPDTASNEPLRTGLITGAGGGSSKLAAIVPVDALLRRRLSFSRGGEPTVVAGCPVSGTGFVATS